MRVGFGICKDCGDAGRLKYGGREGGREAGREAEGERVSGRELC